MAQYFLDTSALVKYYHAESGTPAVTAIFTEPGRNLRISSLGLVEAQSAFALKVRSGFITAEAASLQRVHLMTDVATSSIEVYSVTDEHYIDASRLISSYGHQFRLRTLDALQLAVALDLSHQGLLDYFVLADRVLAEIARQERLNVLDTSQS